MKQEKKEKIRKIIETIIFLSFTVPIIFLAYRIVTVGDNKVIIQENLIRTRSDYVLMLFQCLLGAIAMIIPTKITHKIKIEIPSNLYFLYIIFLYCAIFLGEVRSFYYTIPHWDTILHTFSGAMIGAFGFSIINLLKQKSNNVELSPFFVAMFSFMFAVTLGVIWEIYEFACDTVLGTNMQKFAMSGGEQLIGRLALKDTMEDLIVDCIGALIMSTIGYISLKHKKGWIERILIKKKWNLARARFHFFLYTSSILGQSCIYNIKERGGMWLCQLMKKEQSKCKMLF